MFRRLVKVYRSISWPLVAVLAAGCASSASEIADSSQPRSPMEAFTVIRSETFRFEWYKEVRPVRAELERCAIDAIEEHLPGLRYISRETFTKTAFPNLPSDSAPTDLRHIRNLLDNSIFGQRIEPLNLRYIIYVGGHTEIEETHAWELVGGYMAATAVGMSKWKKDTDVSALVFDLRSPLDSVSTEKHSEGTSWVAGLFPIIIGMPTSAESRACRDIGEQLANTLAAAKDLEMQQ